MDLTKRQQEIFDFIKRYSAEHGYPPTVRDIGKAVGLASSSTVHAHLANLERLGLLRRDPTKPRAIELLDRAATPWPAGSDRVGRPAGPAARRQRRGRSADPRRGEHRGVRRGAAGRPAATVGEFVLQVRGDSMIDAGILEGDYVVVRPQDTAIDGEIVVAMVGEEEATVKRFFREADHVRLQPENATMEPIRSKDVTDLRRVVGLFRSV